MKDMAYVERNTPVRSTDPAGVPRRMWLKQDLGSRQRGKGDRSMHVYAVRLAV